MEYIEAFITLIVIFVIPAAIVCGLVAAPDKSRRRGTRAPSHTAEPPVEHGA
jgi:hypothetical protein